VAHGFQPHMGENQKSLTGGPSVGAIQRMQKFSEAGLGKALAAGDHKAVSGIIGMAYSEIKRLGQYKEGSDEFYTAVGNRAARVVKKTQVSTSKVDRSMIGMSQSPTTSVVSMFFGAREKVINQTREGVIRIQRGLRMGGEDGHREVQRGVKSLVGTIAFGLGTVAMVDLLRLAMRRPKDFKDEDGETKIGIVLNMAVSRMLDTVVGTLPGANLGLSSMTASLSPTHDESTRRLYTDWQGDHPAWSMLTYPPAAVNDIRKILSEFDKAEDMTLNYRERKIARDKAYRALNSASKNVEGIISEFLGIPVYQARRLWSTGNIFRKDQE